FFIVTPSSDIYTLSLHDALPISLLSSPGRVAIRPDDLRDHRRRGADLSRWAQAGQRAGSLSPFQIHHRLGREHPRQQYSFVAVRSEEHTSELQSRSDLVCRLLLE